MGEEIYFPDASVFLDIDVYDPTLARKIADHDLFTELPD